MQIPADLSYDACLEEEHIVMLEVAEKAMAAAGVTPEEARPPATQSCHAFFKG